MKFSIKDFFSKCDQIRRKLRIWSHLLKKSLMENFIFCTKSSKPSMYCVLIIVVMFKPTHSVQSIRIPSLSGPYFPTFRQNTEIHSEIFSGNHRIRCECRSRKSQNRRDTFHTMRVVHYNSMPKLNLIMHVENVEYIFVQKDCPLVTYLRLFAKQKTR